MNRPLLSIDKSTHISLSFVPLSFHLTASFLLGASNISVVFSRPFKGMFMKAAFVLNHASLDFLARLIPACSCRAENKLSTRKNCCMSSDCNGSPLNHSQTQCRLWCFYSVPILTFLSCISKFYKNLGFFSSSGSFFCQICVQVAAFAKFLLCQQLRLRWEEKLSSFQLFFF